MQKSTLDEILERLRATQKELEQEFDRLMKEKREQFQYSLRRGKIVFERGMRRWQRQHRVGLWRYISQAPLKFILTAPVIYSMIFPLVFLDISITIYQHICFGIYGIPRVRRSDFFIIDRQHLAYLNIIEKLNCVYCGYGNALIAYSREITARTEQFWCPIKHAKRSLDEHHRMEKFLDYGDAKAWRTNLEMLRRDWKTNITGDKPD